MTFHSIFTVDALNLDHKFTYYSVINVPVLGSVLIQEQPSYFYYLGHHLTVFSYNQAEAPHRFELLVCNTAPLYRHIESFRKICNRTLFSFTHSSFSF